MQCLHHIILNIFFLSPILIMGNSASVIMRTLSSSNCVENSAVKNNYLYFYKLGEVTNGNIYAAVQKQSQIKCSLKEISIKKSLLGVRGLLPVFNELKALSKVDSIPFVIGLKFAFTDATNFCFVLDFHSGGDLRYHMSNKRCFTERSTALVIACLSSALHFIHERGIIHRYIIPENILFDEYGYPYLGNFSLSHIVNDESRACDLTTGLRQYMAPEIFTKSHLHSYESDWWSLGVIGFEMIYGYAPYDQHSSHLHSEMVEAYNKSSQSSTTSHSPYTAFYRHDQKSSQSSAPCAIQMQSGHPTYSSTWSRETWTRGHAGEPGEVDSPTHDRMNPLLLSAIVETDSEEESDEESEGASNSKGTIASRSVIPHPPPITHPLHQGCSSREGSINIPASSKLNMNTFISLECRDVIAKLLEVIPFQRLGHGTKSYLLLSNHVWFRNEYIWWKMLHTKKDRMDFLPNVEEVKTFLQQIYPAVGDSTLDSNSNQERHVVNENEILQCKSFRYIAPVYAKWLKSEESNE